MTCSRGPLPLTSCVRAAVIGVLAIGVLTACAPATEEPAAVEVPAEETAAVAEPQEPVEEPTTDVIRYGVGDSFTMGDEFFGVFDVTYRGIADMGVLDDGFGDDLNCYAVLVEATLQEVPVDNPDPELGGANVTRDVLDADGEIVAPNYSSSCSDGILADNEYPIKFDIEWAAGTPTDTTLAKLTFSPADIDRAESVDIDGTGSFVLDFELVDTW